MCVCVCGGGGRGFHAPLTTLYFHTVYLPFINGKVEPVLIGRPTGNKTWFLLQDRCSLLALVSQDWFNCTSIIIIVPEVQLIN